LRFEVPAFVRLQTVSGIVKPCNKTVTPKRKVFILLSAITGSFLAVMLNYFVIDSLLIPDPCYYHNHGFETSKLFDVFYNFPGSEGYHPTPTLFNTIFTFAFGAFVGLVLSFYIIKRKRPPLQEL
jgi:hypothetical protein